MKKNYFSPELEEIKIDTVVLTTTSPDTDTTNPVTIIPDAPKTDIEDEW